MPPGVAADDFVGSLEGAVIVGAAESEVRGAQSFNSHVSLASSLLESTADEEATAALPATATRARVWAYTTPRGQLALQP